jgi:hypothetical protein
VLFRLAKAAEFWRCSAFELLSRPEAWTDLGVLYANAEAAGLEEAARRKRFFE